MHFYEVKCKRQHIIHTQLTTTSVSFLSFFLSILFLSLILSILSVSPFFPLIYAFLPSILHFRSACISRENRHLRPSVRRYQTHVSTRLPQDGFFLNFVLETGENLSKSKFVLNRTKISDILHEDLRTS
jgi:hypothetical protein